MGLEKLDGGAEPFHINHGLLRNRYSLLLHGRHRHGAAGDDVKAVLGVLHLPDPPKTVERGVVEVEDRVTGRGHGVPTRVDSSDVVASSVDLV